MERGRRGGPRGCQQAGGRPASQLAKGGRSSALSVWPTHGLRHRPHPRPRPPVGARRAAATPRVASAVSAGPAYPGSPGPPLPGRESLASASAALAVRAALSARWSPSSRHARSAASPVLPTRASAAHGPPSELTVYPLLLEPRRLARAGEAAGLAGRQEGHRRQHRLGWQPGGHGGDVHPLALVRLLHPDQGPHRPLARAEQVPLRRGGRSTSTSTRYSAVLAAARQCVGCGRGVRGSGCGQDT